MTVVSSLVIEMAANVARLKTDMDAARKTVEGATGRMASAARSAQQALAALGVGFIGFQGAQGLIQAADAVTLLGNKLKLASKDATEAALAYEKILQIANRSKVSFTDLGNTYAAISRNTQQLGISQARLFKVTESIANAMTVSGGSAESMKAALVQLGQGMASGTLRGEELNSVMEQTPRLAQALADGMGITIGQLRDMGQAGKITSQAVIEALEGQYDTLRKEVAESAVTIGQAYQTLKNSSTDFVGALDVVNQTSSSLAEAILAAGKTVEDFSVILRSMGTAGKDASKDLGFLLTIQNGLGIAFETVAVLGVNLKFVLVSIGREIGGIAAQAAAVMTGNFSEAAAIGREMRADAAAARTEVDRQTAAILNARAVRDSLVGAKEYDEPRFAKMLRAETEEIKKQKTVIEQSEKEKSEAARRAAAAAKELADAMATYQGLMAKESGLSASFAGDWEKISLAYTKGKITADQLLAAQAALLAQQPAMKQAEEERLKRMQAQIDADQNAAEAMHKDLESLRKANEAMALHNQEIGLTTEQLNALRIARLDEEISIQQTIVAEYEEIKARGGVTDQLQQQINKLDELKKKRELTLGGQEAQASVDAAKKAREEWQRTADTIERSLTDALMRGFESGKGFAQNLRDTLKNMFNTLILRPIIQAVVGGVLGLGGSNASASGGGSGTANTLGQLKSMFTSGASTLAIGGQFLAGTMSSANAAGTIGANMTSTGIDGLLASNGAFGTAGSTATTLGTAATLLGGSLVGFMAGKMISGGYSAAGKSGNQAVAAGTAIGAIVGGPIGAAIGGAIGGLVNRAFGRKAASITDEGITGTFGPTGASVQGYSDWSQKGGTFRSSRSGRNMSTLPTEITDLLSESVGALRVGVAGYASSIGLSADAVDSFSKSISISLKGLDAAGREKAINAAMESFGDDLAATVLGTAGAAFVRTGETSSQALVRLSGSLQGVNTILGVLDQTALSVSLSGADAASKLADLFGGLQGMAQATSAYNLAFYTEAERNAKTTEQLTTALAGMGAKLPETLAGWRALVEAQDRTTEAGRRNYASLIQLAPAFAQVTGAADSLSAKLGKVASQLTTEALTQIDKQIAASTAAADSARAAADAYRSAGRTLTDAARDIMLGVGDVAASTAREYQRVLGLARGGDVDAMGRLPGAATAMLADQRNSAATRVQAMLQAAQAAVDIAGVAAAANTAATAADYQAKLFDVNTAMLEVLRSDLSTGNVTNDLLRQHLTALGNIGTLITDSKNLTVATYTDQSGQIRAGLVDNSGRVVASLDSTTALQLQGITGQTSSFANSITGQTATFGTLSKEQVLGIKKVETETSAVADITDIVARATSNNETLSLAILKQLQVPDAGSNFLSQAISSGNTFLAGRLEGVIAAINKQSEAQQAELKRQQDLMRAQADLERYSLSQGAALTQAQQTLARNTGIEQAQIADLEKDIRMAVFSAQINTAFESDAQLSALIWENTNRYVAELDARIRDIRAQFNTTALQQQVANQTSQYNAELERQRQIIRNLGGVPAFAAGGMHSGGIRLVGEHGPELEVTGPARIFNARQTQDILQGANVPAAVQNRTGSQGDPALRQLVTDLTSEVVNLRAEARAGAVAGQQLQQQFNRLTRNGQSMPVTSVQNDPITVKVAA